MLVKKARGMRTKSGAREEKGVNSPYLVGQLSRGEEFDGVGSRQRHIM